MRKLATQRSIVLSAGESAGPTSTLNDGLVSFWKLDEATGTRVDDLGNYSFTAQYGTPANRVGLVGSALSLDTTNSVSGAASDGYIDGATSWSLAFWFNFDVANTVMYMAAVWAGSARSWALEKTTANKIKFFTSTTGTGGASTDFTSMSALSAETWYHIIVIYNSVTPETNVYINGSLVGTRAGAMFGNSSANFSLGSLANNAGSFDGGIDLACFWQRVLTAEEITELAGLTKNQPF